MEPDRINFEELLSKRINYNSPEVDYIIKFARDAQDKGELSDEEILKQSLKFLAAQSRAAMNYKVVTINKAVVDSFKDLAELDRWSNLQSLAVHAMEQALFVLSKGGFDSSKMTKRLTSSFKVKLAILEATADQYEDIFKPEFLAEFADEQQCSKEHNNDTGNSTEND